MFSSRFLIPLFVYLSLLLASAEAHDLPLLQRDHAMKRLMRKRSPFPQQTTPGNGLPDQAVAGAGGIPVLDDPPKPKSISSTPASQSITSASSASLTASSVSATNSLTSVSSSSSASSSGSSSSASSSSSSSSSAPAVQTSEALKLTGAPGNPSVSTVVPTVVVTKSANQAQDTSAPAPLSGVAQTKSMTLTILIAVAASVGGVAILWTIFRKWKLSSSKKFDQRLNPIDWQPTTGEDDVIPSHRRVPSGSSYHSGSGHGHGNNSGRGADRGFAPLDHDFTAGPSHGSNNSPVGGYADLARGPSPLPPMQENLQRGPSFNRGYEQGVPLHYGNNEAYGGTRY